MSPKRLLIVEDDAGIMSVYISMVRANRFNADLALDGRRAVEFAKANFPDVLLLDWALPNGMLGRDVWDALKALPGSKEFKTIICTAEKDQRLDDHLPVIQPAAVIEKALPETMPTLIAKLKELLG